MIKQIVGGTIAVIIGGSTYAVSQTDITKNFSNNSGMSEQQAQQYINNIPKSDLQSFSKIGQSLVKDGQDITNLANGIDCATYQYEWESPALSCSDGKNQLSEVANNETTLGNCYVALDSDLGNSANAKLNECVSDIDATNASFDLPLPTRILNSTDMSDVKNTNNYNKSVLQSALKAK